MFKNLSRRRSIRGQAMRAHNFIRNTTIRERIDNCKTDNLLGELDLKLMEWNINPKEDTEEQVNMNTCPVCYETIQSTNYIIPKCGHKLCLDCYKKSILSNSLSANQCCLCRQQIL